MSNELPPGSIPVPPPQDLLDGIERAAIVLAVDNSDPSNTTVVYGSEHL